MGDRGVVDPPEGLLVALAQVGEPDAEGAEHRRGSGDQRVPRRPRRAGPQTVRHPRGRRGILSRRWWHRPGRERSPRRACPPSAAAHRPARSPRRSSSITFAPPVGVQGQRAAAGRRVEGQAGQRHASVRLDHANISATAATRWFEMTGDTRSLLVLPLFHVNGIMVSVVSPLVAGGCTFIAERFQRGQFLANCKQVRPTSSRPCPPSTRC